MRREAIPELIARSTPTRTEGIILRGVFRFPIEHHADHLPPSLPERKSPVGPA